jgi:hypothetical protein
MRNHMPVDCDPQVRRSITHGALLWPYVFSEVLGATRQWLPEDRDASRISDATS